MVYEVARRIYASEMDMSSIKAVEDALSYEFRIDYEEANDDMQNASFYFVETVVTKMD